VSSSRPALSSALQSTVTARLSAAGSVIVGKTNMVRRGRLRAGASDACQDEFGMGSFNVFSAHGPTISPLAAKDRPGA